MREWLFPMLSLNFRRVRVEVGVYITTAKGMCLHRFLHAFRGAKYFNNVIRDRWFVTDSFIGSIIHSLFATICRCTIMGVELIDFPSAKSCKTLPRRRLGKSFLPT